MEQTDALTLAQARERFSHGGEWRPKQVARMLRWSRSLIYWHISVKNLKAERYSPRNLRLRGEEIVRFLDSLEESPARAAVG